MKPIQRSRYQSAYVERSERILRLLTAVNSCWTGFVAPVPVDLYSGNELNIALAAQRLWIRFP